MTASSGPHAHRPRARQAELVRLVRERGSVEVTALAALLGASLETVRRDLRTLEEQGLVRRRHGVVQPVESGAFETSLEFRETNYLDEKERIAAVAAEQVAEARTVFLDEGIQMRLVAERLPLDGSLTVITSSIPVAHLLGARDGITVMVLGGRVRSNTLGVVDQWAVSMLAGLTIDLAFIGANGISARGGLSTPDPAVAAVKAAAVRAARRTVLVGAHHKFGAETFVRFAELADVDLMITGAELPDAEAFGLLAAGATLVRV